MLNLDRQPFRLKAGRKLAVLALVTGTALIVTPAFAASQELNPPDGSSTVRFAAEMPPVYQAPDNPQIVLPASARVDADGDGLSNFLEQGAGSLTGDADSDNDGLGDGVETFIYGTFVMNTDTDADLLSDGDEVNVYRTNQTSFDSDGDGVGDGAEVANGTSPRNSSSK